MINHKFVLLAVGAFALTACQQNYPKMVSIGAHNLIIFPPGTEPTTTDPLGPCKSGLKAKISVNDGNKYVESPKVLPGEQWSDPGTTINTLKNEDFGPNSQIIVEAWCDTGRKIGYSKRVRWGHNGYRLNIGISAPNLADPKPDYVIDEPGPKILFETDF